METLPYCTQCGKKAEGGAVCAFCGAALPPAQPEQGAPYPPDQGAQSPPEPNAVYGAAPLPQMQNSPVQTRFSRGDVPPPETLFSNESAGAAPTGEAYQELMEESFSPMGAWQYCGALLLMSLPCFIGFIFTVVWACGGCRKKVKTKLAQGLLLYSLIYAFVTLALTVALVLSLPVILNALRDALPPELYDYLYDLIETLPF